MIRKPIITVLGLVDAGKTKLLDSIRGTALAEKEVGGIIDVGRNKYTRKARLNEITNPKKKIKKLKERAKKTTTAPRWRRGKGEWEKDIEIVPNYKQEIEDIEYHI